MASPSDNSTNPTLTEKLATAIADGILNGTLQPGVRLDEIGLAQQHGVSRTPVREALRQLTTSGLIDMRPRKGAVVSQATPAEVESLFVAMAEMEATCARLAAMSMTPVERRRLQARHEAMIALAAKGDPEAYSDANVGFHLAIYDGAHNEPIADYTRSLRRRVGPFRRAQFQVEGRLTRSTEEHGAVVRAILGGDAPAAHAAMLHHVGLVEDAFEAFAADKKG
jgi:DNA-binding GntR family transcriptional regulator